MWEAQREAKTEKITVLYDRAGDWFESAGLLEEALAHALRGGHDHKAADFVEDWVDRRIHREDLDAERL